MVTDRQVRKLRRLFAAGERLASAARKTGMDEKTARKYREEVTLPSERSAERTWRTREDPFAEVWPEVQARLEAEPRLRAFTFRVAAGAVSRAVPELATQDVRAAGASVARAAWPGADGDVPAGSLCGRLGGVGLHQHELAADHDRRPAI